MPMEFEKAEGDVAVFRVSGKLAKAELDRAQRKCEELIKSIGAIKILVLTENFAGWGSGKGWEDTSFSDRNDPYIKKMAIVGDAKWRDLVHAFTLKGLRPVSIEYFEPQQETAARQWLASA
jgi:SpoIIAA-like